MSTISVALFDVLTRLLFVVVVCWFWFSRGSCFPGFLFSWVLVSLGLWFLLFSCFLCSLVSLFFCFFVLLFLCSLVSFISFVCGRIYDHWHVGKRSVRTKNLANRQSTVGGREIPASVQFTPGARPARGEHRREKHGHVVQSKQGTKRERRGRWQRSNYGGRTVREFGENGENGVYGENGERMVVVVVCVGVCWGVLGCVGV